MGTRSGASTARDPYIQNGMLEKYGEKFYVVKRYGTEDFLTLGPAGPGLTNQGITHFNGFFWGVIEDVLYRQTGDLFIGTTAQTFTNATTPTWSATESMGSAVFKNRMWLIGGVTESAGIWSTVDGEVWTVNAGGQPWGFRSSPGVCVFQNRMFVIGGFNITLGTSFNDVWVTEDGTNWENILPPGPGGTTQFPERTNHCVVATNNGIYVFGGEDAGGTGTYFNDVWYTADGITWNELTSAAPWTARADASCYFFQNKIWVVCGLDSGGNELNDAWSTYDGITWTQTSVAVGAGLGRFNCGNVVYRDQMWLIMGETSGGILSDIYSTTDGATWTLVTSTPGVTSSSKLGALVFGVPASVSQYRYQTIWLLGGSVGPSSTNRVAYGDLDVNAPTFYALSPDVAGQPYQFQTMNNGTLLLIKNQSNMWVMQSGSLVPVTDPNYPAQTVPGIAVMGGFAFVLTPQGEVHNSNIENPFVWGVLDFLTADYENDPGVAIAKHLNYVVVFGQWTTQFFYNAGTPEGTPLLPQLVANLRIGCVAAQSVQGVDNFTYFVGQTENGGRSVYRLNGTAPEAVSSPYVDKVLMVVSTAFMQGINYAIAGHNLFLLKTAAASALAYDVTQGEWYLWDTFPYGEAITSFATGGMYLWANEDGALVVTGPTLYTDAISGDYTFQCQTDKVDHGNTALKFGGRVVMVGDRNDADVVIAYSDDDDETYYDLGTVDMDQTRPFLTRLGAFRRRAWRPRQTDDQPARWEALEVTFSQGES